MEEPNDITDREFYGENLRQSRRLAEELEEAQAEIAELIEERSSVRKALLLDIGCLNMAGLIPGGGPLEKLLAALDRVFPADWQECPANRRGWTLLSPDSLPSPERPLLVTKNIGSRLANGQMSMLWLVSAVQYTPPRDGSREEFYAYTREGEIVRWLTHWRLAVPEEEG
jgi:hypothetical protein